MKACVVVIKGAEEASLESPVATQPIEVVPESEQARVRLLERVSIALFFDFGQIIMDPYWDVVPCGAVN